MGKKYPQDLREKLMSWTPQSLSKASSSELKEVQLGIEMVKKIRGMRSA